MKSNRELVNLVSGNISKDNLKAILIVILNFAVFALSFYTLTTHNSLLSYVLLLILHVLTHGMCFVIGHDLCHKALFKSNALNHIFGRIFFSFSLTPFTPWHNEHNLNHHRFTNLVSKDIIWLPLSFKQYIALNFHKKILYKIERSVFGAGFHWVLKFWIKHMIWRPLTSQNKILVLDVLIALTFIPISTTAGYYLSNTMSLFDSFIFFTLIPHIAFSYLVGFVTYIQHTNQTTKWYKEFKEWSFYRGAISSTIHVKFPKLLDLIFHRVMHHNAHHVNPSIPLYKIASAQKKLKTRLGEENEIQEVTFTFTQYLKDCYQCKLYDFDTHTWLTFKEAELLYGEKSKTKPNKKTAFATNRTAPSSHG